MNTRRFMRDSAVSRVQGCLFISPHVSGVGIPRLFSRSFWILSVCNSNDGGLILWVMVV